MQIRAKFERNRCVWGLQSLCLLLLTLYSNVSDPRAPAEILQKVEVNLAAMQHSDPYICELDVQCRVASRDSLAPVGWPSHSTRIWHRRESSGHMWSEAFWNIRRTHRWQVRESSKACLWITTCHCTFSSKCDRFRPSQPLLIMAYRDGELIWGDVCFTPPSQRHWPRTSVTRI